MQQKTQQPVQFEITEQKRQSLDRGAGLEASLSGVRRTHLWLHIMDELYFLSVLATRPLFQLSEKLLNSQKVSDATKNSPQFSI